MDLDMTPTKPAEEGLLSPVPPSPPKKKRRKAIANAVGEEKPKRKPRKQAIPSASTPSTAPAELPMDDPDLVVLVEDTLRELRRNQAPVQFKAVKSADVVEGNQTQTCGVVLHVDGVYYSLPMEFLQSMNQYHLSDGKILFAPYPFWRTLNYVFEDMEDDEEVKKYLAKVYGLGKNPTHPCLHESCMIPVPALAAVRQ
jgi:hypothetical protein